MKRRDPLEVRGTRFPFAAGELVVRTADGELLEVVEVDASAAVCRLEDGTWVRPHAIEAPLRASYRWDLERDQRREARRAAIERGDFDAAFPGVAATRAWQRTLGWAALGWLLAGLEGVLLASLLVSQAR